MKMYSLSFNDQDMPNYNFLFTHNINGLSVFIFSCVTMYGNMNGQNRSADQDKLFTIGSGDGDAVSNGSTSSYETTPLLKSQGTSESTSIYYDAVSSFSCNNAELDVTMGSVNNECSASNIQASVNMPSTRLSSYSSARRSYDYLKQNKSRVSLSRSLVRSLRVINEQEVSMPLAVANLLPFLLGSATFALPYAVMVGGYATIPAFAIITILADVTGLLLVDALYDENKGTSRQRLHIDYVELAKAVAGKKGAKVLNFALIFYLYAMNTVNLVLIGRSLFSVLHHLIPLDLITTTAVFSSLVLPTLFIKSLAKLAYLSMMSTFCIITGGIASQVVFIRHHENWAKNLHAIPLFDGEGFAFGTSVWFFMLICHSVVPQIENSMREPRDYPKVLHISHSFSAIIKIYFAITGALTFGNATKSLVSLNIEHVSEAAGIITNIALAGYAVTSFPINFYVVCETFDHFALRNRHPRLVKGGKYYNMWVLLTRPGLVGVGLVIAVFLPYFGMLVGVIGSLLAIFLVFIFPCWFHLSLKSKSLPFWKKSLEVLVMVTGTVVGAAGLYASVKGLVTSIEAGKSS